MSSDVSSIPAHQDVIRLRDVDFNEVAKLLSQYGLTLNLSKDNTDIPGSFWGDDEAGLIADQVYARNDTPLHSILHESCHYICMDQSRRRALHTNAGGTADEENAVCYLQIILSNELTCMGAKMMMKDMDSWGYSFRLGSCAAWYQDDTVDEVEWLLSHGIITESNKPTFLLRQ